MIGRSDEAVRDPGANCQGRAIVPATLHAKRRQEFPQKICDQGDAIWAAWFVLSTNADCRNFLKQLDKPQ